MFLQISSCHKNLFIERNTSYEDRYLEEFPRKTHKNDKREEHVPWITEENVQLEILTPTDSEALGKRYFVPNGDRGEKWLQFYFQGCDTGGILVQSEIKEREGRVIRVFSINIKFTMLSMFALKAFPAVKKLPPV